MGFPPYLIGIGIPLLVGLLGIGLYIFNQERHQPQTHYNYRSYERRKSVSFCDDSEVCTICYETMSDGDSAPINCGHKFHSYCLVELNKRNQNKCPNCRADINYH